VLWKVPPTYGASANWLVMMKERYGSYSGTTPKRYGSFVQPKTVDITTSTNANWEYQYKN